MSATNHDNTKVTIQQQQPQQPQILQQPQKQKSRKQKFLDIIKEDDRDIDEVKEQPVKGISQNYNREHCVESKSDLPLTIQTSESINAYALNECDNNNKSYRITIGSSEEEFNLPALGKSILKKLLPLQDLGNKLEHLEKFTQNYYVWQWRCESVVSPVEDVLNFDRNFERHEAEIEHRGYFPEDTRSSSSTISSQLSSQRSSARLAKRQHQNQQNHKNKNPENNTLGINNFTEFKMRMQKEFRHQPTLDQLSNLSARLAERCNYDKPTTSAGVCLAAEKRLRLAKLEVDKDKMLPPRKRKQHIDSSAESEDHVKREINGFRQLPKRKVNVRKQAAAQIRVNNANIVCSSQPQKKITGDHVDNNNDKNILVQPINDNNSPKAIETPNNHNKNNNKNNDNNKVIPNKQHLNIKKPTDGKECNKVTSPLILLRQDFSAKNLQLSEIRAQLFTNETLTENNKLPPNILLPPMPEPKIVVKKESPTKSNLKNGDKIGGTHDAAAAAALSSHRKHVFYNLLGLTNMSTVKACNVASAELAKSPTQRRSLRVRQQEQQKLKGQMMNPTKTSPMTKISPAKKYTIQTTSPTKIFFNSNNNKNSNNSASAKKIQIIGVDRTRNRWLDFPTAPSPPKISKLLSNDTPHNNNNTKNTNDNDDSINDNKPAIRILYRFSSISQERERAPESNIFIPPKLKTLQELKDMSSNKNWHTPIPPNPYKSRFRQTTASQSVSNKVGEIPQIIMNTTLPKVRDPIEICMRACNSNAPSPANEKMVKNETKVVLTKTEPKVQIIRVEEFKSKVEDATKSIAQLNEAEELQKYTESENHNNLMEDIKNVKAESAKTPQAVAIDVEVLKPLLVKHYSARRTIEELIEEKEAEMLEMMDIETDPTCLAEIENPVKNVIDIKSPTGESKYIDVIELVDEIEEAKPINNSVDNNNMKLDINQGPTHSTTTNEFEYLTDIQKNEYEICLDENKEISANDITEIELINNNTQHVDNNNMQLNVYVKHADEKYVANGQNISNNVAVEYVDVLETVNSPVEEKQIVADDEIISKTNDVSNNTHSVAKFDIIEFEGNVDQQSLEVNCHKAETINYLPYQISYFNKSAVTPQRNPLKREDGQVLHIFFELDVLMVVQEFVISFWKYSRLMSVLKTATTCNDENEWFLLDRSQRLINDMEISTAYSNRLCINNSIPVYLEMRGRVHAPEFGRTCPLLALYVNVYYYHEEDMHCKIHSVNLDTIQCPSEEVTFTTIPDSRYFIMCWSQVGSTKKRRTGMVKYSLTPQLDTLASIREFKDMRHTINLLECANDDKLLGFGETQLTIWDHRSGDVLMNYDFEMKLGRNVGSIYYPSVELGQNNMMALIQYICTTTMDPHTAVMGTKHEILLIICGVSHIAPTYRLLKRFELPQPAFRAGLLSAENNGEHLVLTAKHTDVELWISCVDPNTMIMLPAQNTQRFYVRGRTQIIELTDQTLTVDNISNHLLKLNAVDREAKAFTT